ncbi:MAG: GntR family transcriptional regulator [Blautia sp.]|nr:GntR family transcriptional regulator [Blautia sp.]
MISKYQQITEWIWDRLASGELSVGDKLESENQISTKFGISRQTVRRALSVLIQQGILESRQGSGTFVSDHPILPRKRKTDLSKTITVISTYIDGYIFLKILQTMAETLEEYGYNVKIEFTNNRREEEKRILESLLKEEEHGPLIVEPVMSGLPNLNLRYYRQLQAEGVPILFFHTYYPDVDIPHVSINDVEAGRKATEYLISKGHRKIGGIFKLDDGQGIRRYQGYLEAMENAMLEADERKVCWIDSTEREELLEENSRIWKRLKDCTACVCYNDQVASSITESAGALGIHIPEELSIVSIDNSEIARLNSVPLTSVEHPKGALGKKVAEHMLKMIEDPEFGATYEYPVFVEERDSVIGIK